MKYYAINGGSFTPSGKGDYEEVARFEDYKQAKAYFNELIKKYEDNDLKEWTHIHNGYVSVIINECDDNQDCDLIILDRWSIDFN